MMPLKKPRLLNLAAGVSLLLAIAIIFLWVRSYWRVEGINRLWHTSAEVRNWTVGSRYGRFHFVDQRIPDKRPPIAPRYEYKDATPYNSPYPRIFLVPAPACGISVSFRSCPIL